MSLPAITCGACPIVFVPKRRTQKYHDAICSKHGGVARVARQRAAMRVAPDPGRLLARYRSQARKIKQWVKDVGECPCCGWTGDPLHQDGCPLKPVERSA